MAQPTDDSPEKIRTDPHVTWASRLLVALSLFFGGRSIYLLITEGPNPLAISITLLWANLLTLIQLRQSAKKESQ